MEFIRVSDSARASAAETMSVDHVLMILCLMEKPHGLHAL